ncbi:unnamed protein product [Psylliodes chrysocephalus]|uniref:DUF4780 domain-containing protein n=1 Tax=Psylliodes chrysocephalus TaxID=3402493 RepID=A0A9P0CQK4_9CUCU|nr:unnamed protein product [Psylliodes chrysocephala]
MEELDRTILFASFIKTKPPTFRSWTYSGKIIREMCDDDLMLEWLKTKVPTLKTWEGAALAVVRMDELPKLIKASLWISGEAQADLDEKKSPTTNQKPNLNLGTGVRDGWLPEERREQPLGAMARACGVAGDNTEGMP